MPSRSREAESAGLALQHALGAHSIEDLRDIGGDKIVAAAVPRAPIVLDGRYVIGVQQAFESGPAQRRACRARLHARRVVSLAGAGVVAWPSSRRPSGRTFPQTAGEVLAAIPRRAMRRARGAPRPISAATCRSACRWPIGPARRRSTAARRRTPISSRGGNRMRRASRSSITTPRRPARITRLRFRTS